MSRIGQQPIAIPEKVDVTFRDGVVTVKGPGGTLTRTIDPRITVNISNGVVKLTRASDRPQARSLHGLYRSLINNMVRGVDKGFVKEMDLVGVGYRAEVKGNKLNMTLGFSHPVNIELPDSVEVKVDKMTHLTLRSPDNEVLGDFAANLRKLRKPEPYKGKGIRYSDEVIRRKAGKTAGAK